jgi:hypothetical protein
MRLEISLEARSTTPENRGGVLIKIITIIFRLLPLTVTLGFLIIKGALTVAKLFTIILSYNGLG